MLIDVTKVREDIKIRYTLYNIDFINIFKNSKT